MSVLEHLGQDLRFGLRALRKNIGFAALAVLTLALGIGANTAIFSVINGVLLKPLPYRDGDRLYLLQQHAPGIGRDDLAFSIKEVMDYREQLATFDGVVEYHSMSFTLLSHGEPDRVLTGVVSHNFFDVLGVNMLHGRGFVEADDRLGAEAVLVLSYPYWQQKFGSDPEIVGQVFQMNDKPHTVVGVLPPIPQWPRHNDVYMPTVACPFRGNAQRQMDTNRGAFRALTVFGRVKDGLDADRANADLSTVAARFVNDHPDMYGPETRFSASTMPLFDELTENARPMLLTLLGSSGLVLLIACANVANLMLARTMRRERELAVRAAIGAGRGRLLGQLLTESTLLAILGGLLGFVLATQGLGMLSSFAGRFTPRTQQIGIDGWVLGFTLGVSVLTGLAFGAMPAVSSRARLVGALKEGGAQSTESAGKHRLRAALIIAQVAISFVLLIGAGLLLTSFWRLQQVDPGFRAENVVTAEVFPNWSKYTDAESTLRLFNGILDGIEGSPGVVSAAIAQSVPLAGNFLPNFRIELEGHSYEDPDLRPQISGNVVSADYFATIGVPLLSGRTFTDLDHADAPSVAIVSESLARRHWADTPPVGSRIRVGGAEDWTTVVGVAGDVRQVGLETEPPETLYLPVLQRGFAGQILVRASGDPATIAAHVRDVVHRVDADQPVENFRTLEEVKRGSVATPRLTATLLAAFAGLALMITLSGLAGVIATSVGQRTQEFGIRMALGARPGSVLGLVLRQGLGLVVAGLVVGVVGALAFGRLVAGFLYQTEPTEPVTFVAVCLVFVGTALVACWMPARRATAVDPMIALRSE